MVDDTDDLVVRTPEAFRRAGIDARIRHRVSTVDLRRRAVEVVDLDEGRTYWEPYDHLLLATGARPVVPEGIDPGVAGVYTVKSLDDARAIKLTLQAAPGAFVVVVGGGYIGVEMAENLRRTGRSVTVVDRNPTLMAHLDPDMSALVTASAIRLGITLALEEALISLDAPGGVVRGVETDRAHHPAQIVILGLGVRPDAALAASAGVPLGAAGAVHVDEACRTGVPDVFAAGDCADAYDLVGRRHVYQPLATHASKQGRVAGLAIAGRPARFPGVTGTSVTQIGSSDVSRTGLGEREIRALGVDAASAAISSTTRVGYMPDSSSITVKLWGERGSGRLLGGQIVGGAGAGKRIDVIATALSAAMTVEDLLGLDLAYSPGLSDTWDPVQVAARVLVRDL